VLRTYPAVAQVKQALYLHGAEFAQLSGSGSSVYGLFAGEAQARAAMAALPDHRASLTAPGFRPE
jgi:4-diphosphocytidyl-2-C-methyl-D-erythritol kinase